MKQRTHVIIGRFQCSHLHDGYLHLFKEVDKRIRKEDKVLIIVGKAPISLTDKNPLKDSHRVALLWSLISGIFPDVNILVHEDNISDIIWSNNLDEKLKDYSNVILYGSRDSFIPRYHGKHKTEELPCLPEISSTDIRKQIAKRFNGGKSFLEGIIYAVENRFPIVYSTVDIAVIKYSETPLIIPPKILLGRKENDKNWYLPGGFVDPKDNSHLEAAHRELQEEVPGVQTLELRFLTSMKVDDWRYRGTKDSIMTNLYITYYIGGPVKAGDDLIETHWFKLDKSTRSILGDSHKPLYDKILNYIQK